MSRIFPHPLLSLFLILVWLLLNNTTSFGHIVLGSIIAILVPVLTREFWLENIKIKNTKVLFKFIGVFIWDVLVANVVVAKLILSKNSSLMPAFMVIDLDIKNSLGVSILANTISLTPGTVSCDLSLDRKQLLVHALHAPDVQESIDEIKKRYELPLMEVFD